MHFAVYVRRGGDPMKYRALTISREYGSGGARIAQSIARQLGWRLLDSEIITAIAERARVDSRVVMNYDERAKSWLRRMNEEAMRGVATMAVGRPLAKDDIFDAQAMEDLTRRIIEEAHAAGNCVIVGRGAQCILQHKPDTFHVFVYAPLRERLNRLKMRLEPGIDAAQRLRTVDSERAKYVQRVFGVNWCDFHFYDMMISTKDGEDEAARLILAAVEGKA